MRVPQRAKRGEQIEIRAMVQHPMESGFRLDNVGKAIPRNIATGCACTYAGKQVFRATFHPAVSANPYLLFYVVATQTGDLVFTWTDDKGGVVTHAVRLEVEG